MKITKNQLRRIIKEEKQKLLKEMDRDAMMDLEARERAGDLGDPREELANQIRMASKDAHGRKDVYDLENKTVEEMEDILHDLGNSDVVRYLQQMDRDEMEDQMGRDQELSSAEMAPKSQGMGRRPAGSKSQRRMESAMKISREDLQRIIKEEKQKLLVEMSPIANAERMQGAYSDTAAVEAVENALSELMFGTNEDAFQEMGDEDDADDAAAAAVTLTVAQSFQSLGLLAQYEALIRTLR